MASGIAHDINNAISPVALYTESLLEREPNLSERARSYLTTIQRAIEDVAATVARMREFYRQREPQLELARVDVNRIVQQVIDLTRARWSDLPQQRGVVVDLQHGAVPTELPEIMGAESEIRDALTNLIFNAVDAMPEGGTLTLRTRVADQPAPRTAGTIPHVLHRSARHRRRHGRRDAPPLPRAVLHHQGRARHRPRPRHGLRHGAAAQCGARDRQRARQGHDFPPDLPGLHAGVRPRPCAFPSTLVAQRLRILLVDDDPLLIKSLQDTLEGDGHVITTANGGQAGIDAFTAAASTADKAFDIVITDLGMPYVDGRKVAAAIKASSARTPVILLTGWGQRLIAENDIPPHVDRVLSKPPRLHELRAALAELTAVMSQEATFARILVVDDEAAQMKALCDTLGYEGYAPRASPPAKRALEALREQEFDLLLTDLMMPEMDGIELLSAAREIAPGPGRHHDDRPRHHRYRGQGDAGRRARLHPQAVQAERDPAGAEPRARGAPGCASRTRSSSSAVAERTQRARSRQPAARVANKELEAFSYSVSHDLRAPLRAVQGFCQIYMDDFKASIPQDGLPLLEHVLQGSQRMGQLIEDLLEFSRLGRQPILRQIVPLDRIVTPARRRAARQGAAAQGRGAASASSGDAKAILRSSSRCW